jgi:CHAT domain-containing protein/tetratricopeptide (TPR) repeat protein
MPTVCQSSAFSPTTDVLWETDPDPQRVLLWLKGVREGRFQFWERVVGHRTVQAAAPEELAIVPVRVSAFRQELSGELRKFFYRFWGEKSPSSPRYLLPSGGWAVPLSQSRADAVLVWTPEGAPNGAALIEDLWPGRQECRQLGSNLFLVLGVEPPPSQAADAPAPAPEPTPEPEAPRAVLNEGFGPLQPEPEEAGLLADFQQLSRQVRLYAGQGLWQQALDLATRLLGWVRREVGEAHSLVVAALNHLGWVYQLQGNHAAAEPFYRQALMTDCPELDADHPDRATSLNNLALAYQAGGNLVGAEPLLQRALHVRRARWGDGHPLVAVSLNNLGLLYHAAGQPRAAEPLLCRAFEILNATLGENHPDVATCLENLAGLCLSLGKDAGSSLLAGRAQQIRLAAQGQVHERIADTLNCLAEWESVKADAGGSGQLQPPAAEISPPVAAAIESPAPVASASDDAPPDPGTEQATLATSQGVTVADPLPETEIDAPAAEAPLPESGAAPASPTGPEHHWDSQATAVTGEEHSLAHAALPLEEGPIPTAVEPEVEFGLEPLATSLTWSTPEDPTFANSSAVSQASAAFAESPPECESLPPVEPLDRPEVQACPEPAREDPTDLGEDLAALQPDHAPDSTTSVEAGDAAEVTAVDEPASPDTLSEEQPDLGEGLIALAEEQGTDSPPSAPTDLQAVANLIRLAESSLASGNPSAAEPLYRQALEARSALLGQDHPDCAESLRRLALVYAATGRANEALPLLRQALEIDANHLAQPVPNDPRERRQVRQVRVWADLDLLLSLVVRHLADTPAAVQSALEAVLRHRADVVEPPVTDDDAALALEQRLRSAGRQEVAQALPAESVLVEFVRWAVFDCQAGPSGTECRQPPRYLAFVLPARDPAGVRLIDLGEAEPIDRLVMDLRAALTGAGETNERGTEAPSEDAAEDTVLRVGMLLRQAVFDPVAQALGSSTRLFLVPAGELACLPFEVLPAGQDRHVIDTHEITYLLVGRDVLRFGSAGAGSPTAPVVVGDPDFDLGTTRHAAAAPIAWRTPPRCWVSRGPEDGPHQFTPLAGTRRSARAIADLLGVEPWLGGAARKRRLAELQSPQVLHLATHCFFSTDEAPEARAGLALAGANLNPPAPEDDGLLTVEELAALNLLDTELVVLPACAGGPADTRVGHSVLDLRRALVRAGAETLVMSLWKVADWYARKLLADFYGRLLAGESRAAALRQAQLALKARYPQQPSCWGAFICQGDPGPVHHRTEAEKEA